MTAVQRATLIAKDGEINGTTVQTEARPTSSSRRHYRYQRRRRHRHADGGLRRDRQRPVDARTIQIAATADNVVGNALTSGSWIDIDAQQDVTGNALDAETWVTINAARNAAGNQITAGTTVALTTTLDATGNLIDAGGAVAIVATQDATGNVVDAASAEIRASEDISRGSIDVSGTALLIATSDIQGVSVNAGGTVTLTATNGYIQGVTVLTGDDAELSAGLEIDATDITAWNDIHVNRASFIAASSFIAENGVIDITGVTGNIVDTTIVLKDSDTAGNEMVYIVIGGELDAVWIDAANDIDVTASYIVDGMYLSEGGDIRLDVSNSIIGADVVTKDGDIRLIADVDVIATDVTAAGNIHFEVAGDVVNTQADATGYINVGTAAARVDNVIGSSMVADGQLQVWTSENIETSTFVTAAAADAILDALGQHHRR